MQTKHVIVLTAFELKRCWILLYDIQIEFIKIKSVAYSSRGS